jgi:hypothetical protein
MPLRVRQAVLLLVLLVVAPMTAAADARARVRIDPRRTALVATVSDRFVSFAVDMDQLVGGTFWDPTGGPSEVRVPPYDFTRERLRNLTAPLAPAYLRLGGSASDVTYYDVAEPPLGTAPAPYVERLTAAQWDGAADFATALGLDLILTLNAGPGPRDPSGVWTDTNARALLEYAAGRGDPLALLEFGNEPNLFAVRAGLAGYTADEYARDFATVAALRDTMAPGVRLGSPGSIYTRGQGEDVLPGVVLGPRITEMLPLVGSLLDVVEYHYYAAVSTRCPPSGPRVDAATALEPAYLDGIDEPISAVGALRDLHAPGAPVWLTESGGQSCGGQLDVGDRFLNAFWYLNTLGRMARAGNEVFVRQTLSGSTYGLLDDVTLEPRPDYWAALLWRRLMGTRVLVPKRAPADPDVRVFTHCTRDGAPGAVTVLALNTSRERTVTLRMRRTKRATPGALYLVTAPDPAGTTAYLNGTPLVVSADGTPPALASVPLSGRVALPPVSYAFVVVPNAEAAACAAE